MQRTTPLCNTVRHPRVAQPFAGLQPAAASPTCATAGGVPDPLGEWRQAACLLALLGCRLLVRIPFCCQTPSERLDGAGRGRICCGIGKRQGRPYRAKVPGQPLLPPCVAIAPSQASHTSASLSSRPASSAALPGAAPPHLRVGAPLYGLQSSIRPPRSSSTPTSSEWEAPLGCASAMRRACDGGNRVLADGGPIPGI